MGRNTYRVLRLCALTVLLLVSLSAASLQAASPTATYQLVFEATWSAATHPVGFPGGPHFSGLIGGTHNANVSFWVPGDLASPGIEAMAETGSKTTLSDEVQAAITAGDAATLISGGGISVSPGSVSLSLTVSQTHSQVTVVSMIAPSPDWFVGVHDLQLFENGAWVASKVISLLPYDAGTDSGTDYTSPNQDTNPADPISLITTGGVGNGVPLGTLTLLRTDAVPAAQPRTASALAALLLGLGGAFLAMRWRRA